MHKPAIATVRKNAIRTSLSMMLLAACASVSHAQEASAGKLLFDPSAANAAQQVTANGSNASDQQFEVDAKGIAVTVAANGKSGFPGVIITPPTAWDASAFGHVEAKVTNQGTKPIRVNLRIDNEGPWQENRNNTGIISIKPGETQTVSAIFGYNYGKRAYALDPKAISKAVVFIGKSDVEQKFRIEAIQAAGPAGETPAVDPNKPVKPEDGIILGGAVTIDAKQVVGRGGAKASSAGKSIQINFNAGAQQSVLFKPLAGAWNLNQHLQVRIKLKNTGATPITPAAQLQSRAGVGDIIAAASAIAPGSEGEIIVPFMASKPWQGVDLPEMRDVNVEKKGWKESKPGSGTLYGSNATTGVILYSDADAAGSAGEKKMEVTSILADMPPRQPLPEWLGKKPPVEGEWSKTFEDNFDGTTIDLTKWNIYTQGNWHLGKETAYSKDNVIVKDGKLALRVEKRRTHHNDNPAYSLHNYATGWADSYGKWTQRYGYFEARLKLPDAPNMFTAFWMMPDRGIDFDSDANKIQGQPVLRNDTKVGGMEFDIMEQLSIWGPNRHDIGMHWDGYMKYHKTTGSLMCYFHPDAEGFVTVGMLWTPGVMVIYQNGKETARWETDRISTIPSYLILQNITGGWETEGMDDSTLPADLVFDYVRAWQRKDLASDLDGPKPNDGGLLPPVKK